MLSFLLSNYLGVDKWDHTVKYTLVISETVKVFCKLVVSFHPPSSRVRECQLSMSWPSIGMTTHHSFSHSNRSAVVPQGGFICIACMTNDIQHLL